MEFFSVILSLLAIVFSLFTYFKHDIKIKKQEALLNQYELEKFEAEKLESKRAIVEANMIKGLKGQRIIKVYNKGKSIARDVKVSIPELKGIEVMNNPCPIDIRPQNSIEISLLAFAESPDKMTIEIKWQDEFQKLNLESQVLQI